MISCQIKNPKVYLKPVIPIHKCMDEIIHIPNKPQHWNVWRICIPAYYNSGHVMKPMEIKSKSFRYNLIRFSKIICSNLRTNAAK